MRLISLAPALYLCAASLCPQQPSPKPDTVAEPSVTEIMTRVAANQDRSAAARSHFVYVQHAHVISRKGKTIRCEETTDSRVVPSATGSTQQIIKLDGHLLVKGRQVAYTHLPVTKDNGKTTAGSDNDALTINLDDNGAMDRDLVENMRDNLVNSKSKDGIAAHLFPLTSDVQKDYEFHLIGRERLNDRDVFHLSFQPKDKSDFGWKGDAYIDIPTYEPVVVRTAMSRKIPFAVRTLLGTSLPGLGFTVIYAPQPGDVWFPVSFGTEFKMNILFFFRREIILNAENRDFEKTHVSSTVLDTPPTIVKP